MLLELLRSLPTYRPGIAYILSETLYLAPTACSPAARTMRSCRGPSFADPQDGGFAQLDPTRFASRSVAPLPASRESKSQQTADQTGFQPLAPGEAEPTAAELAALVDDFCTAAGARSNGSVVFQGNGDPLEAASVVVDTVRLVAARTQHAIDFRLNTLGLCDAATAEMLFASSAFAAAASSGNGGGKVRISGVSIFLPAAEPSKYELPSNIPAQRSYF